MSQRRAASERARVAICVCTYGRPEVLRRLLGLLAVTASDASDAAAVGVVVVDDDPDGSARSVVDAEQAGEGHPAFALGVHYANTASGNISVARNRALECGIEIADWLALIDDDCAPEPDWLRQLLTVQAASGCDCVSGHCIDTPPPGAPAWLTTESFLDVFDGGDDGAELAIGPLKNTLISADFLRRTGLRFDEAMGRIGGEDALFFHAAHDAGMDHRYAAKAVVREEIPIDRATLRYQLRRRYWYGNTEAVTSIASGRYPRWRLFASAVKVTAIGLTWPLRCLLRGNPPQWRWSLAETLRGIGRLLGAAGMRLRHH